MIDFINSIGQRKVSKILFALSFILAITSFLVKDGVNSLLSPLTWFGVFLMVAPIGILSRVAHKTKDYRLFSLFAQVSIIFINLVLFFLDIPDYFFVLIVLELISTIIFLLLFGKSKPTKVQRKTTTRVKPGEK